MVSECDDQITTADNWQYIIQYFKDAIINFYNIYSVGRFHPSMQKNQLSSKKHPTTEKPLIRTSLWTSAVSD